MLQSNGKISLYDIFLEVPSIKPINIMDYRDYYNLSNKVSFSDFYGKKQRYIREVLTFKNESNLSFQLTNRRPQTPEMIFNNWGRIKGNLFYLNKVAAEAASDTEATAWYFQNNQIYMPLNVEPINGFVSNMEYDSYSFECTLSSDSGDNDAIGLIPAFHRENENNYYLCFYVNMSGTLPYTGYGISYQGADATHTVWGNASNLLYSGGPFNNSSGSAGFGWSGRTVKLKVERQFDIFNFWFSDINSEILPNEPQFTLDLNSNPKLLKFRGKKKYGYMTNSQPNSTYKGIVFQNTGMDEKLIIDTNKKEVYRFNESTESWYKTPEQISEIFENKSILLNPEGLEYTNPEKNWYEIVNGSLVEKGEYSKNILPTISKIKNNSQFIEPIDTDYSLTNLKPISNTISVVQRIGLYKNTNINDIPISSISSNQLTVLPTNFEKLNNTNLDRSTLIMEDSNIFIPKIKSQNIIEVYNPKNWYLLNIDIGSTIANVTGTYPVPTDLIGGVFNTIAFYNNKYYIGSDNGAMVSEDLQNFTVIPEATKVITGIGHYKNYISLGSLHGTFVMSFDSGATFQSITVGSYNHIYGQLFVTENGIDYLYAGTQAGFILKYNLISKQLVFAKKVADTFIYSLIQFNGKIVFAGTSLCGEISLDGNIFAVKTLSTIIGPTNNKTIKDLAIKDNKIYCAVSFWGILSSVDGTNWVTHPFDSSVSNNTFFLYNENLNEFFINFTNSVKIIRTSSDHFESIRSTQLDNQFFTISALNGLRMSIWEEKYQRYLLLLRDGTLINYKV